MYFRRLAAIFFSIFAICTSSAFAKATGASLDSLPRSQAVVAAVSVVVIPVEGEVDYGLLAFLKRATLEALEKKPNVIVYKVNTYGGELHSAFEIVDLITSVKKTQTAVYVEQKAISAGALIALACNRMAMGEGTTIGDCAPITQSSEGGIVMLGEKIQSPLRAKFRNLAERNGYPSLLSQAMVTADIGVVAAYPRATGEDTSAAPAYYTVAEWAGLSKARKAGYRDHSVLVRQGELLTLTDREAHRLGFSQGSFHDFDTYLKHNNFKVLETLGTMWSEDLARILGKFAPLFILLGFGALYLEFKTPGLSIFGAIGALCLGIAFGSKYAVGLANHNELLLLLGGLALFAIEIYLIPGTFIAGFLGLAFMLVALTLSLQGFTVPDPGMPWEMKSLIDNFALTLGMAALALFIPLLAVRFVLPYLPRKAAVVSAATLADAHGAGADLLPVHVGETGVTHTGLRPSGKAVFAGVSYEVASRGEFVDAGSRVEILRVQGRTIVVGKLEADASHDRGESA